MLIKDDKLFKTKYLQSVYKKHKSRVKLKNLACLLDCTTSLVSMKIQGRVPFKNHEVDALLQFYGKLESDISKVTKLRVFNALDELIDFEPKYQNLSNKQLEILKNNVKKSVKDLFDVYF